MTLTNRDKVLVWVLPAALILLVYGLWINGALGLSLVPGAGKQTDLAQLQKAAAEAAKRAPAEEDLQKQKARQMSLSFTARQLEADLDRAKKAWEASAGRAFDPATRNERVSRLNAVFAGHDLVLIGDSPAESGALEGPQAAVVGRRGMVIAAPADEWVSSGGGGPAPKMSPALEKVAKSITARSPQLKPRIWRLRLYGRYADLAAALEQLSGEEGLCVPVGLTMDHWDVRNRSLEWTLLVWI